MDVLRDKLIKYCDDFLTGNVGKEELTLFSEECIASGILDTEENKAVIATVYDWENEDNDIPINEVNIKLWKERLVSGVDRLIFYNNWRFHIEAQREKCLSNKSSWVPINPKHFVGVSDNILADPLNGLRHLPEGVGTGWFLWSGNYSDAEDFFKPICADHLLQMRPEIIKYLALESGFRFLIDSNGYEDVWYDKALLSK